MTDTRNHEITKEQRLLNEAGSIAECGWSRKQLSVIDDRLHIVKHIRLCISAVQTAGIGVTLILDIGTLIAQPLTAHNMISHFF